MKCFKEPVLAVAFTAEKSIFFPVEELTQFVVRPSLFCIRPSWRVVCVCMWNNQVAAPSY